MVVVVVVFPNVSKWTGLTEHIFTSLSTSQMLLPFGRFEHFNRRINQNVFRFYGNAQSEEVSLYKVAYVCTLVCNVLVGCIGQTGRKMK